jgi:hypothetical protein
MKIFTFCMGCQTELGHPSFEMLFGDYFEDATADVTCSRGHRSSIILQSSKFEILLDSAANAILEGYTLEGCATLYAAYERFIEFAIKVMCVNANLEERLIVDTFKAVSAQSERQIGAFIFLHTLNFKETYKPNKQITESRNKFIHKGYIPNKDETLDFGDKIYAEILHLYQKLEANFSDAITNYITMEFKNRAIKRHEKAKLNQIEHEWSSTVSSSFFTWSRQREARTYREALDKYHEGKEFMDAVKPQLDAISKAILAK